MCAVTPANPSQRTFEAHRSLNDKLPCPTQSGVADLRGARMIRQVAVEIRRLGKVVAYLAGCAEHGQCSPDPVDRQRGMRCQFADINPRFPSQQLGNLFRITRNGAECLHRLPLQYYVTR